MIFDVRRLEYSEWCKVSKEAHMISFGEFRPTYIESFNFAIAAFDPKGVISGWITCHEMDKESLYLQYGGVLPVFLQ